MKDFPIELGLAVGLCVAGFFWITKSLIPKMQEGFNDALKAFREELRAEREFHERMVEEVRGEIRSLKLKAEKRGKQNVA